MSKIYKKLQNIYIIKLLYYVYKYIINVKYILYIYLIYTIMCSSVHSKRFIPKSQKVVFQEKITNKGQGSERFSEILRESIRSGLLEEGIRTFSYSENKQEEEHLPQAIIESLSLFRSTQFPILNKKNEKREVESSPGFDFSLEGSLFTFHEGEAVSILLYLSLKNSQGEIIQYYTISRQDTGLLALNELGKEIGKNISKEVIK